MLMRTMLPSLWKSSNLPDLLARGHTVTHHVHCPPSDREALSVYESQSRIPVIFHTDILTDDHNFSRHEGLYRCFQNHLARESLTVVCPCDHVFGAGLADLVQELKPGDYMVCGHPRIQYDTGVIKMQEFLSRDLDRENQDLVKFCMEAIPHPMVEYYKVERTSYHPFHKEYWKTRRKAGFWQTFMAEPPPVALWGSADMLDCWKSRTLHGPWEVIDHDLPNFCYQRNRLKLVTDSRKFFWAEFTSNNQYTEGIGTRLELESLFYCHTIPLRWYYKHG